MSSAVLISNLNYCWDLSSQLFILLFLISVYYKIVIIGHRMENVEQGD